jgi:hypothetical protein
VTPWRMMCVRSESRFSTQEGSEGSAQCDCSSGRDRAVSAGPSGKRPVQQPSKSAQLLCVEYIRVAGSRETCRLGPFASPHRVSTNAAPMSHQTTAVDVGFLASCSVAIRPNEPIRHLRLSRRVWPGLTPPAIVDDLPFAATEFFAKRSHRTSKPLTSMNL